MLTAKLCKACENGSVKEVEELLACGATPNFAPSGNGYRYPLHYAATSGHVDVVKLLLQHGTAVDPLEASNGWTPLMIATLKSDNSQKHIDVMMLLLEGGADAEVMDAQGNTMLHILAARGQTKLLKRLIQKIPSLDVLGPGFGYLTPLHYAAEAGHVDTVDFLLHLLADPRCVDATGWTPLHWACRRGHKQVVDLLLRCGGSIEDRDFRSLTPLDVACLFNHTAMAKALDGVVGKPIIVPVDSLRRICDAAKVPPGDKGDLSHTDGEPAANARSEAGEGMSREESLVRTSTVEQNCFAHNSSACWRGEKYHLGRDGRALARLVLGVFILSISVCDYCSRISMAAFFATAARTFDDLGPAIVAATVLACCSVVLPSAVLGICCSCHFRNTGIWAAWRTAKFIHVLVDPKNGEENTGLQRMHLALEDLFLASLFRRLVIRILYSGNHTVLKLAAAGCILPPAAVACCCLIIVQIVVVAVAALFAVLSLEALTFVWISAFKVFLISRRGLLFYLDCLTHASALWVNSTEGGTQKNGGMSTPTAIELPINRIGQIKSVYEQRFEMFRETTENVHPFVSVSSPRYSQSSRCAGEQRTESKVSNGSLADAKSDNTGALEDKENQTQCQRDPNGGDVTLPLMRSAYYASATYCGSVPQTLHPCPSLQWSIQLHRQHLEINRDRQCLVTPWKLRTDRPEIIRSSPSGVSGTVSTEERGPSEQRQFVQGTGGWTLHESNGGLLSDSLQAQMYAQDSDGSSAASDEAKETFLPSGLEQEPPKSPRAGNKSPAVLNSLNEHTDNPWFHGILAFVYGGQVQETHGELQAVGEGNSVTPSLENAYPKEATIPRCDDTVSRKIDTIASVSAGASPYGWMPRKLKRQYAAPVWPSPPMSPPFISRGALESPPEVSGSRVQDGENLNFPCDSDPRAVLPTSGLEDRAVRRGVKLLFTRAHPGLCLASAESSENQEKHVKEKFQFLSGTCGLEKRKRRPLRSHIDDAKYDAMVLQRERCIFNWFEKLIAFRFAELTEMSKLAEANIDGATSEGESCSSGGNTEEIRSPMFNLPSSADPADIGIKWDTFGTLFPQTESATQVDSVRGELAASPLEENRVSCLRTEDLFDLPIQEPVMSDAREHLCGKGRRVQRGLYSYRNKIEKLCSDSPPPFSWSNVAVPDTSGGGSSTRGDSGSDQLAIPILHYRFKDMMELPHLRETFFSLWCREFERLLLYQDHYFGRNPIWTANTVREDSISGSSQGDSPRPASGKPCPSTLQRRIGDEHNKNLKHSSLKEALWITARHIAEAQTDCTLQYATTCEAEEAGADECIASDQIPTYTGPPEPPISCTVAVSLEESGARRCPSLSKRRRLTEDSPHGLLKPHGSVLAHSNTASDHASVFGVMEGATGIGGDRSAGNSRRKIVLVAEACRFLFALSLTLDLVVGLLPLLGSIILFYLLPYRSSTYPKYEESNDFSSPSVCSQSDSSTTALSAVVLLFAQSDSLTSTFCALRHLFLWSFVLTAMAAFFYAALLFSQASRLFYPLGQGADGGQALNGGH